MVEHNLAKVGVASSSLVFRSKLDSYESTVFFLPAKAAVTTNCGNSSVGRAQPCQGWGREFESRFPLQESKSFMDKIKQNPLKHRFRGFFICCRSVSFRHRGASTRHSQNLEVSAHCKFPVGELIKSFIFALW